MKHAIGLCLAILAMSQPARAQEEDRVDDIIVTARRSGAPIWEVTRDGHTVLLVGGISGLPRSTPWSAAALEAATMRSQRVISGTGVSASFSDLLRVIWRSRSLTRLPGDTTSADYLEPEWQSRLDAIEARVGEDYSRQSFLLTASDLVKDGAGYGEDTGENASTVVRRAARQGRIETRRVQPMQGNALIEDLLTAAPETRLPCMHAAIAAAEAGPEAVEARGVAWTRFEVAEVMASPIQQAVNQCWPWGDPTTGPRFRTAWVEAIDEALGEDGVTLAVTPLELLAETGGVLDQLEAQGATIEGPPWKSGQD